MGKLKAYPSYIETRVRWLGQIPEHWSVRRLSSVTSLRKEQVSEDALNGVSVLHYSIPNVQNMGGAVLEDGSEIDSSKFRVIGGEILVSKLNPRKQAVAMVETSRLPAVCSTEFVCLRPNGNVDPRFLYYTFLSENVRQYLDSAVESVTRSHQRVNPDVIYKMYFAAPPYEEQVLLSRFLDHETARIDRLIAKQERLIELLKEKRQAVISHAVTKGLNPDAPMKDSGVEWLGEVPAHWAISQLRYETKPGTSITYGIVQAGPDIEGGVPYIRTSDMSGSVLPADGYMRTSKEIDYSYRRSKVRTGDLVIAIRATVGKTLPVPSYLDGANLTQGTAKFSPGARVDSGFVLNFLSSEHASNHFGALAKGATFKEITLDMLRRFPLPLPPLDEQKQIAKYLETKLNKFHLLIGKAERAIELQKEHRTALISAAVTGRIDVRNWQPSAADSLESELATTTA